MQIKTETLSKPRNSVGRRVWRIALAVLIVVPFLPELAIYAIAALVLWKCDIGQKTACLVGPVSIGDIIAALLDTTVIIGAAFWFIAPVWLAACYLVTTLGWSRTGSRLSLALLVSLIFAFLPYVAPLLLTNSLVSVDCTIVPCWILGGEMTKIVRPAPDIASWGALGGLVIAFGAFFLYAIGTLIFHLFGSIRKRHEGVKS